MIGDKIKKCRRALGLTQNDLAKKSGVAEITIRQYESGKRQPRIEQLKKLAKTFDIALYLLVDDKYEIPDITSEAWENRFGFRDDTEMEKPSYFTMPMSSTQFDHADITYERIKYAYNLLNKKGQEKVTEYAETLAETPKYQKD